MRHDEANRPRRTKSSGRGLRRGGRRRAVAGWRAPWTSRPALESLEPRLPLAGNLLIAEFMAVNQTGLKDEDGDASDWVEVFNNGTETADLNGWHLTDDPDQLTKWEFPSVQLPVGHGLVVFASNKDRDTAGSELHTNFRLSGSGEYLALVSPDGSTVVDKYDPYPQQYADVSYGREQSIATDTLLSATSSSRRLLPNSPGSDVPTATWTATNYNDAAWTASPAAIGYDQNAVDGDFAPLIAAGGQIPQMAGQTPSAYLRTPFQYNAAAGPYDRLDLTLNLDDGFVAYLNGTEVLRQNAADPLAWDTTATRQHGGVTAAVDYANFVDLDDQDDFNLVGSASFQSGRLQLTPSAANQTGAAWLNDPLTFGADYSFSASTLINVHTPGGTLDADGRGGHGMTFVLQTGGQHVIGGPAGELGLASTGMTFVAIEFDSFASGSFDPDTSLATHIGIDTSRDGNVARVAVPRFNGHAAFPGQPGPGVDLRYVWIEYNGQSRQMDVYFADTNVQPATPTLSANVDLAGLFSGVTELWAGWTAATGDAYNAHDVRSFQLTAGAGQLGLGASVFSLTDQQQLLRDGTNVLAIHGSNVSADDDDFLLRPQLVGTRGTLGPAKYFSRPTPGELNGVGDEAPTGEVGFSASTKAFVTAFDLVLTPPNANAIIRYTTNGAIPSESSTLYSGPIRISNATRIRARAFETGRSAGPVRSESFIVLDTSVSSFAQGRPFSSNLPVMIFESYGRNVESSNTLMVPVSGVFIDPAANGRANVLDVPEFGGRAGLRIRGQSSEGFAKKQFALELWDELNDDTRSWDAGQVQDRPASIFGLPSESDWVLNGPYSDKTQLNNYLTFLWSNKAGLHAPRGRLVEVFLNQDGGKLSYPGDYRGTYVLLEKIKRDNDRVDIAPLAPDDNRLPEISGGYIWKKDKDGAGDVPFTTSRGQQLRMVEPDDRQITTQQKGWLQGYINEFEAALYGPNFADPNIGYAKYIDVDSWATTWLLVEMTKNIDGFRLSTYYHKDRDGKIKQGPAWDYNLALANGNYLKGAYPQGWYKDGLGQGDYPYWDRLFQDPNFQQRVVDRWAELRATVWSTESLLADIDAAVNALSDGNPRLERPAAGEPSNPISRNFAKWGTLTTYLWPNCFFGQGDCPASPLPGGRSPSQYADYIFIMKDFVQRRAAWIDTQFPLGPQLTPAGGAVNAGTQVTIDVPAGWTAIYTTDGSDPRQPISVSQEDVLLPAQSPGQVLVPQNSQLIDLCNGLSLPNPSACFMNPDYVPGTNGESWTNGSLGVGYDQQPTYLPYINTDVGAQMDGKATSAYIRVPFNVTAAQTASLTDLSLRMRYDDGFVAYLWSSTLKTPVEIARANAPGTSRFVPIIPLAYDAAASASHDDAQAVTLVPFNVSNSIRYLRPGTNYLVIQGLNASTTSSDFLIDAELVGTAVGVDLPDGVFEYDRPIVIDHNVRINARLLNDSNRTWSGMTSELYVTSTPAVTITEINYHPAPPTVAELAQIATLDEDDFEFIELRNNGSTTAHLVGSRFTSGIDYVFPTLTLDAGEYGVLVKDEPAFRLRYGDTPRVLGQFGGGSLDNGGETLALVDGAGREMATVGYGDNSLWPQAADGLGATLQLVDPANTPGQRMGKYTSWRASTEYGGSPGRAGEARIPIVVNEVLPNTDPATGLTDAIELMNTGTSPLNLGGWYVSDSRQNLLRYRIPDGTVLAAGSYLVLTEADFNPTPTMPLPHHFSLNGSTGDDVWVTVVDGAGNLAKFVDDVHFGAAKSGESLGRMPNGSGLLTPLMQRTLGAANQNPRIGPVLITEVMYQPAAPSAAALAIDPTIGAGDLEFVEIANPTGLLIDLTNWRLRVGVDYDFAAGLKLASGQSLLVLPFNPDSPQNANRVAAFRAQYNLDGSVRFVGGYAGQLSNNGDRLALQRPDQPLPSDPNVIPRLPEDEVVYDTLAPWPVAAAGGGSSLQRVGTKAYGNAATSWKAANPTPGVFVSGGNLPGDFNTDGRINGQDLDLFCLALRQQNPDPVYDLNSDGRLDEADRDVMVQNLLGTTYGDADLNGVFDSSDLIQVLSFGQYEDNVVGNSTWLTGDFNCDGEFDTGDLVLALASGGYASGASPAARPANHSLIAAAVEQELASRDAFFARLGPHREA